MKEIYIKTDFIKLGQFLKFAGIISNGSDAKEFINSNLIKVNGEVENRRGRKIQDNFIVIVNDQEFIVKKG